MKVLFLSNLYPNSKAMTRATYNRQKIAHLKTFCDCIVVAPVSWYPCKELFDKDNGDIPLRETIDGLEVYHPRVFYTPGFFRFLHGIFYYLSICSLIKSIRRDFDFDIIFSSWIYPDGFAAMKLADLFKRPFVALAHGSDINIQLRESLRKRIITSIARRADRVVAVSVDLGRKIAALGVRENKISVIYDGIDHKTFFPQEKSKTREKLGVSRDGKLILFVGNLVKVKGLSFLVRAFKLLEESECSLVIVGGGPLRKGLEALAKKLSIENKVKIIGPRPHDEIAAWMNASDLLCLPSLAEGLPDVVLEALACGRPVVASRVGGIPELIVNVRLGVLTEPGDIYSLANGLKKAITTEWDSGYINRHVAEFSWDETASKLFECFKACVK